MRSAAMIMSKRRPSWKVSALATTTSWPAALQRSISEVCVSIPRQNRARFSRRKWDESSIRSPLPPMHPTSSTSLPSVSSRIRPNLLFTSGSESSRVHLRSGLFCSHIGLRSCPFECNRRIPNTRVGAHVLVRSPKALGHDGPIASAQHLSCSLRQRATHTLVLEELRDSCSEFLCVARRVIECGVSEETAERAEIRNDQRTSHGGVLEDLVCDSEFRERIPLIRDGTHGALREVGEYLALVNSREESECGSHSL